MNKTLSSSLTACLCLLLALVAAQPVSAQEGQEHEAHHQESHQQGEPPHDEQLILQIVADIAAGWENADGAPFERHYLDFPGARYIESGGQNEGLRDLVDHHVVPEGDALSSLELDITNVEVHFEGGFAWALGDVEVRATIASSGDSLHRRGFETFLFRWVDDAWKVIHTHSSTRPVRN